MTPPTDPEPAPDDRAPAPPFPGAGATTGWSTRELAEMAGTTVNTVRHYHRIGLLDEPERLGNGYKQYRARHLARLVRIRRLRELGLPLTRVERLGDRPGTVADSLRVLDAELAAGIERLQRARAELAALLRDRTPIDVPAGFGPVAGRLGEADRALLAIYSTFYDERALGDIRRMIEAEPADLDREFDAVGPDTDEETRERLAERVARALAGHREAFPWLAEQGAHRTKPWSEVARTAARSLHDLYGEAQRDVLRRAVLHLYGEAAAGRPGDPRE
ncbi:helix-turn-helix domain-containing protein [Nocardiopsis flavescens]